MAKTVQQMLRELNRRKIEVNIVVYPSGTVQVSGRKYVEGDWGTSVERIEDAGDMRQGDSLRETLGRYSKTTCVIRRRGGDDEPSW